MDKSHAGLNTCFKKLCRINYIVLSRGVGSSDLSYTPILMFHQTRSLFHKKIRLQFAYAPYFNQDIQAAQG